MLFTTPALLHALRVGYFWSGFGCGVAVMAFASMIARAVRRR